MQADWEILNYHATLLHTALIVSFLKLYSAVVNFFLLYNVLTVALPQEGTLPPVMGIIPVLAVAEAPATDVVGVVQNLKVLSFGMGGRPDSISRH